jgi:hypothetical protein
MTTDMTNEMLDDLDAEGLGKLDITVLRKYATHLGVKGSSRTPGGKEALVPLLLAARKNPPTLDALAVRPEPEPVQVENKAPEEVAPAKPDSENRGTMRGKRVKIKDLRGEAKNLGNVWTCHNKACGKEGPPDDFGYRTQGGFLYRQIYCRPCRTKFRTKAVVEKKPKAVKAKAKAVKVSKAKPKPMKAKEITKAKTSTAKAKPRKTKTK